MQSRIWLSRTLFESVLIVVSILLALTVAEVQENRELEQLVARSLANFNYEISQNKNRIDDIHPFHLGLHSILMELQTKEDGGSAEDFRNILDSFQSAVLLASAWETALATGALTHMDYEIVSALSLTYSIQNRFQELHNTSLAELSSAAILQNENMSAATYAAIRYMRDVTMAENELQVVYQQALELIGTNGGDSVEYEEQLFSDTE